MPGCRSWPYHINYPFYCSSPHEWYETVKNNWIITCWWENQFGLINYYTKFKTKGRLCQAWGSLPWYSIFAFRLYFVSENDNVRTWEPLSRDCSVPYKYKCQQPGALNTLKWKCIVNCIGIRVPCLCRIYVIDSTVLEYFQQYHTYIYIILVLCRVQIKYQCLERSLVNLEHQHQVWNSFEDQAPIDYI